MTPDCFDTAEHRCALHGEGQCEAELRDFRLRPLQISDILRTSWDPSAASFHLAVAGTSWAW